MFHPCQQDCLSVWLGLHISVTRSLCSAAIHSRPGSGLICHIFEMGRQTMKGIAQMMTKVVNIRAKKM